MNIKLRQADSKDIPALKKLWQICFNDRMKYINIFFEKMFIANNTVVAEYNNRVVGVVYILDRELRGKRFLYGYGIGVLPEFRGNDICETMLNAIKEYSKKENLTFGLHPANEKLAKFYQKIGLNEMYSLKEVNASGFISNEKYELLDITLDEFYNLRCSAFKNSVEWGKKALKYILENGEAVKKIALQDKNYYFVLNKSGNTVIVKETNANEDVIIRVTQSIKDYFNAKNITFFLSNDSTLQGEIKPVIYGFSEKDTEVYMNLFLD